MRKSVKWFLCLTLLLGSVQTLWVMSEKTASAAAVNRPFPQHQSYASGVIKPNNVSQSQMDNEVKRLYNEWKARYLKKKPVCQQSIFRSLQLKRRIR